MTLDSVGNGARDSWRKRDIGNFIQVPHTLLVVSSRILFPSPLIVISKSNASNHSMAMSHVSIRLRQRACFSLISSGGRLAIRGNALHRREIRPFSAARLRREKKYTQDHEWIELADDQQTGKSLAGYTDCLGALLIPRFTGTIGVSTYAAKALGDVVYVELPQTSADYSAGDTIGAVESVKSASDIMTPVSGTIVEANALLEEKPGTINKSPESEGWIAKVKLGSKGIDEIGALMAKAEYDKFTGEIAEGEDH